MAVLDDMDRKLDELLSRMGEEINLHPDELRSEAYQAVVLPLTWNVACAMQADFRVVDRDGGRYLVFRLRDATGCWVFTREWRCVYRDPMYPGLVVDRPGQDPRFRT